MDYLKFQELPYEGSLIISMSHVKQGGCIAQYCSVLCRFLNDKVRKYGFSIAKLITVFYLFFPLDRKNGSATTKELLKGDPDAHNFQEYTYKKITPCDVCSQVLRGKVPTMLPILADNFQLLTNIEPRVSLCSQVPKKHIGHTRQGLKCRICKMNVHLDCQDKASKCQTKARLLRRQKSTSEIETRIPDAAPEDEIARMNLLKSTRIAEVYSMPTINRRLSIRNNNRLYPPPNAVLGTIGAKMSPFGVDIILFLKRRRTGIWVLLCSFDFSKTKKLSRVEAPEVDQIYQVLKQATEISNSKPRVNVEIIPPVADKIASSSNPGSSGSSGHSLNRRGIPPQPSRAAGSTLAVVNPAPLLH
ncbi:hypothetical protein NQ317_014134 [Molorchus minor]|uniref:Phorbol-ester/DAG-type domain-containing protein n=1 Tax=Molorchus minor TaxID=1323400 RepID=A0ABQ9JF45_9CUCU|nr:hypothetical protein NQ317_014134 [Molorchus minor]